MHAWLTALQFLTRLPLARDLPWNERVWGESVIWYAWVGLLIGGACLIPWWWIESPPLAAALTLLVWVALAGALHLDGLADLADAWIGSQGDRDKAVAIMKDPRSGPMAIVALVLVLLLKFAALLTLAGTEGSAWILLLVPLWARAAAAVQLITLAPARADGLVASLQPWLPEYRIWRSLALALLLSLLLAFGLSLLWLLLTILWLLVLQRAYISRFGGLSGDLLGATIELTETLLLGGAVLLVT